MKNENQSPIPFDKALRLVIGGRLRADRYRILRQWWKALNDLYARKELKMLSLERDPFPRNTPDQIIELLKRDGVDEFHWNAFQNEEHGIAAWRRTRRREQRIAAIKSRWAKRRKTRPLTRRKKRKVIVRIR